MALRCRRDVAKASRRTSSTASASVAGGSIRSSAMILHVAPSAEGSTYCRRHSARAVSGRERQPDVGGAAIVALNAAKCVGKSSGSRVPRSNTAGGRPTRGLRSRSLCCNATFHSGGASAACSACRDSTACTGRGIVMLPCSVAPDAAKADDTGSQSVARSSVFSCRRPTRKTLAKASRGRTSGE